MKAAYRKSLRRRLGPAATAILTLFLLPAPHSAAQGDKPQLKRPGNDLPENKPQESKKLKKGKEPRAVGLLEFNSGGKETLVPIAILIDGKFYDASAYKADPTPMALESGTVYEAEQAGDPQGLFTVNGALHSKSAGSAHPWVGSGSYLPQGMEAPKNTRKAEDVPVGLDISGGDEPPRLTRKGAAKPTATPDASSTAGATGPATEKPGTTAPASAEPASDSSKARSSGQDAPKPIVQPTTDKAADQSAKQQSPAPGTGSDKTSSQTSQGQTARGQTSQTQEPPKPASASPSPDDYYRPALRRGKPTQPAPDEDSAVAKKGEKAESGTAANPAGTMPVHVVAAISDAAGPEPQSYKFFWKTGEEEERRNQMLAAAGDEVRAYAAALVKNQILARPAVAKPGVAARKTPIKQAPPVLENVQFRVFDVWLTNQPVMILSAEAHFAGAPGTAVSVEPYSIMLVTRTDIYGNLRKLYSGVTDKFHLDVTPRLELIDVVDADGDGRGELLFRETSDAGSGYAIYRATADKLWKMFDSLNAE